MNTRSNARARRRGITAVQTAMVLGLILLLSIALIRTLGSNTKTSMTSTAGNIGNPSTLPSRFGS